MIGRFWCKKFGAKSNGAKYNVTKNVLCLEKVNAIITRLKSSVILAVHY